MATVHNYLDKDLALALICELELLDCKKSYIIATDLENHTKIVTPREMINSLKKGDEMGQEFYFRSKLNLITFGGYDRFKAKYGLLQ